MPDEVDWDAYNAAQRKKKQENHDRAMATFEEAKKLATVNGFDLFQHGSWHFSLTRLEDGKRLWRLNLYPSNQRIWADKKCGKAPFLKVPEPWNFVDVVMAAICSPVSVLKKALRAEAKEREEAYIREN